MKFKVYDELFEKMPDACFGVVVGFGVVAIIHAYGII